MRLARLEIAAAREGGAFLHDAPATDGAECLTIQAPPPRYPFLSLLSPSSLLALSEASGRPIGELSAGGSAGGKVWREGLAAMGRFEGKVCPQIGKV